MRWQARQEILGAFPGTGATPPSSSSCAKHGSSPEADDKRRLGKLLLGSDEVVATLGEGTFGQVVECIDHKEKGRHVAVKIIKEADGSSEEAFAEVRVLRYLRALDPSSTQHCVQMLDWFEHRGHVCIVLELLGLSTFDFMKENGFLPFRLDHIRQMAYQICQPPLVSLQKCQERRPKHPDIRVGDFGSTTRDDEHHSTVVTTRPFRAPEVILALGWSQPCDVWSIGCILLEYYLGSPIFPVNEDKEHLAMMERILGPLPSDMIKQSRKRGYFHQDRVHLDERSSAGRYVSRWCKPLKAFMTNDGDDHENLFDLIEKMLRYDPAERITLGEALKHPFFLPLRREKRLLPSGAGEPDPGVLPPKKRRKYRMFVG
ncbi:dual specificity protein kinase CLK1-like [Apus apus]|uniref:dual specificity protein kinase CLK1-like n=1 Tax=Apus apus TaxID=8895 RepID=UPI0021F81E54|nr:dual specificity protein kinase CLK1-like [Apus apus]